MSGNYFFRNIGIRVFFLWIVDTSYEAKLYKFCSIPRCIQKHLQKRTLQKQLRSKSSLEEQPLADVLKIGFLKSFAIFTGKHLCWSVFLNKVVGLRPATLLEKKLQHRFFCENCTVFKNTVFREHLRWRLMSLETQRNFRLSQVKTAIIYIWRGS